MDSHLMQVERSAEIARDMDERREEARFDVPRIPEADPVLDFYDSITPRKFCEDSSEILLLPGGRSTWVQFHEELLDILTMAREKRLSGQVNGRAMDGLRLLDLLEANVQRYLEVTQ